MIGRHRWHIQVMTNRGFLLERMERFLQCRLAENTPREGYPMRPSITISRQCGTGIDAIEKILVDYLDSADDSSDQGWALFNQSLVGKVIENGKLDQSVEPFLVENTKFPVLEAFEELLNLHPSNWTLFNHTASTIRKLCRMGGAIVVGRAGNFVTADLKNTFHVRLIGSDEFRIEYTANRYAMTLDDATEFVKESDKGRAKYVKRYAHADIDCSDCYHLIINTDNCREDSLAHAVGDAALEWAGSEDQTMR